MILQFWMLALFCLRLKGAKKWRKSPSLKMCTFETIVYKSGFEVADVKTCFSAFRDRILPFLTDFALARCMVYYTIGVIRMQAGTPRVGDLWPSIQLLVLLLKVFKIWVTTDKEDFCVLCLDIWIRERLIQNIKAICWWSDIGNIIKFPNFPIHLLPVDIWDQICHAIALLF